MVEYVVGRSVAKPLVGAFLVEVAQVVGNSLPGLAYRLVGAPIDFFLLESALQTLHIHVVEPAALPVHRDTHTIRLEHTNGRSQGDPVAYNGW